MKWRRVVCGGLLSVLALGRVVSLSAQADPRQVLAAMILQVQTGRPNPLWYGAELWQTIALQTNNTGYYPQLAQLGPVTNIVVTQQLPLPAGVLYAMTAQHQLGLSYWVFGISRLTNRIEYATFAWGATATPYQLPGVQPGPPPETPAPAPSVGNPSASGTGRPAPSKPAKPDPAATGGDSGGSQPSASKSEACKKFPNMCPDRQ